MCNGLRRVVGKGFRRRMRYYIWGARQRVRRKGVEAAKSNAGHLRILEGASGVRIERKRRVMRE